MLPDGEHVLYVDWDARAGRYRARVLRLAIYTTKDLIETDSRVMYTASTVTPGTGYLLYIRGGNLLAHPFDPRSLRVNWVKRRRSQAGSTPSLKPAQRISPFRIRARSPTRVMSADRSSCGWTGRDTSLAPSVRQIST